MYLVLDFGGTNIKAGLMEDGILKDFFSIPARSAQGMGQALLRVREQLLEKGVENQIEYVGIATPGVVDCKKKRILSTNEKYADGTRIEFKSWCHMSFGCPLIMDNDANAALYGELTAGCAVGVKNAVMMTLGTGIGTAAVMEGRLLRGIHYQAGILGGHFVVDIEGKSCSCGGKGCLETLGGSRELASWIKHFPGYEGSLLAAQEDIHMKTIVECMENGDVFSATVFDRVMDIYGAGIVNLIHAYDPELVILSGGIMQSKDLILPRLQKIVKERAWTPWGTVEWETAKNPNQSVLLGLNSWIEEAVENEKHSNLR